MAEKHRGENGDTSFPRVGSQEGTGQSTKDGAEDASDETRPSQFPRLGRRQIGDDDRGNHRVDRELKLEPLGNRDREARGHCRPQRHLQGRDVGRIVQGDSPPYWLKASATELKRLMPPTWSSTPSLRKRSRTEERASTARI